MRRLARFACVRQTDQSDCGPACLATVALQHGVRVGREALRDAAGTDRVGTNLLGMVQAAEALGFSARACKATWEALGTAALPAVVHVRNDQGQGHFVVLHRVAAEYVVVADPARGVERRTRAAFVERWTGYVILLAPAALAGRVLADEVPPWRRLVALVARQRRMLVEGYLCAMLLTLLGIASSLFVQHVVDSVATRGDRALLDGLAVGMIAVVGFRTVFAALRQYLMAWLGRQAGLELLSAFVRHVLRVPMRFFETRRTGEILSRVADTAKIRDAISGVTLTAVVDVTMVVVAMVALFVQDVRLALVASSFVPILGVAVLAHHLPTRRRARDAMEQAALLQAHLVEDVAGVETVKTLGLERQRADEADDLLARFAMAQFGVQKIGVSLQAVATCATGAASVAVLWYGSHRVLAGELSLGQLMFCNALLAFLLEPLQRLATVTLQLQDALVAVDRLDQVLAVAPEATGGDRAPAPPLRTAVELRRVSFRYGPRAPVLHEVDLVIPAGRTTAIVGESGSGKSTLLKLLLRFHEPSDGQILVDGTDLRDLDLASWRDRLGVVPQDPTIFSGSLRHNVLVGAPAAPPDAVAAAVRAAGLDTVVARLPDRWDTVVGERGANLSGGQRQRLAIARALLRQPSLLLLDEATSHLDTATERLIQGALDEALAGRTVVVVAHRLSTIRKADQIVVMHDGRIAERGDHDTLLAAGGRYAALWLAQAGAAPPAAALVALAPSSPCTAAL